MARHLVVVHVRADLDPPVLLKATHGMTRNVELSLLAARMVHAKSKAGTNPAHNVHLDRGITLLAHDTATRIDGTRVLHRRLVVRSR